MRNRKKYSEEWTDTIRPSILSRDLYKCTRCRIPHRSYVLVDEKGNYTVISKDEHEEYKQYQAKTYRIYLQVAHLDNDPSNNHPDNLSCMCPKCHLKFDKDWALIMRVANKLNE